MAVNVELQNILDALEDPRLLVREDFTVAYANRAFRGRFPAERFDGRHCHELLFHEKSRCGLCGRSCPLERASVTRHPERSTERELIPGGERFLEIEVVPVNGVDGDVRYFMEKVHVREDAGSAAARGGIVARSPAVKRVVEQIARVAVEDDPVLFLGSAGSGKSIFARFLHENSRRAANAFVQIDCHGLSEECFEKELLGSNAGHSRGLADEPAGTLYFNEITELSPILQRRLLQLVESRLLRETGHARSVPIDWRVVCSTSVAEAEKRIRSDLWQRLSVARIRIPSLSERREDLEELVRLALKRFSRGGMPVGISPEALSVLAARSWPGNLRELECTLRRAQLRADSGILQISDLKNGEASDGEGSDGRDPVKRASLLEVAGRWRGTRSGLAKAFGISERTLYRRLKAARASGDA